MKEIDPMKNFTMQQWQEYFYYKLKKERMEKKFPIRFFTSYLLSPSCLLKVPKKIIDKINYDGSLQFEYQSIYPPKLTNEIKIFRN